MSIAMDIFVLTFLSHCDFPLCCLFPLVLVVVSGPFMLGQFTWMSLSISFQIIPPNSDSVDYAMKFLMILNATRTGPFYGGGVMLLVCWIWG